MVRVFAPDGQEVLFHGANDPHTPIGQGWLRASHRALDAELSKPYRPYHTHTAPDPLEPYRVCELDVEIWPACIVVPAGHHLALTVRSRDYEWDGPPAFLNQNQFANPLRGCGPLIHDDPADRTPDVAANDVTLYTGDDYPSHLLVPVIPAPNQASAPA